MYYLFYEIMKFSSKNNSALSTCSRMFLDVLGLAESATLIFVTKIDLIELIYKGMRLDALGSSSPDGSAQL